MKLSPNDHPWDEVRETFEEKIKDGAKVYQKFTCESCRARLTIDDANVFHTHGKCDHCGHVSNLRKNGCNYMVTFGI